MEQLSLTLFGDVKLTVGSAVEISLPRKTQVLLAFLASNVDKQYTREKIANLIWADRSEKAGPSKLSAMFVYLDQIHRRQHSITCRFRSILYIAESRHYRSRHLEF